MHEDIIAPLATHIAKDLLREPARVLPPGEKLVSSGIIDSFNLVDLALYIESAFGVRLDDMELNADCFDTLEELAALIASRMA